MDKLNLDDFLKRQNELDTDKFTVELLENDDKHVKVTPWTKTGGCACNRALKIEKTAFKSVSPTKDEHFCCGKRLLVVTIDFKEEYTLKPIEVLNQLAQNISPSTEGAGAAGSHHFAVASPQIFPSTLPFQSFSNTPAIEPLWGCPPGHSCFGGVEQCAPSKCACYDPVTGQARCSTCCVAAMHGSSNVSTAGIMQLEVEPPMHIMSPCHWSGYRCVRAPQCNPPWGCVDARGHFQRCGTC